MTDDLRGFPGAAWHLQNVGSGSEPPANPDDEIMAARNRDEGVGLGNDEDGSPTVGPLQALREALEKLGEYPEQDSEEYAAFRQAKAALVSVEEQLAALQRERDEARENLSRAVSPPDENGVRMICLGYHEETDEYEWLAVVPLARGSSPSSPKGDA